MDESAHIEELRAAVQRGEATEEELEQALAAADDEPERADEEAAAADEERRETVATLEALEKEAARHEKALVRILGAGATDTVCDRCEGVGYLPPGQAIPEQPNVDPDARLCPLCEGWGVLATGSIKPGHEARDCSRCGGRGYLERLPEEHDRPREPGEAEPERDEFGTPSWMGDPNVRPPVLV